MLWVKISQFTVCMTDYVNQFLVMYTRNTVSILDFQKCLYFIFAAVFTIFLIKGEKKKEILAN